MFIPFQPSVYRKQEDKVKNWIVMPDNIKTNTCGRPKIFVELENGEDTETSDLGLHCLPTPICPKKRQTSVQVTRDVPWHQCLL